MTSDDWLAAVLTVLAGVGLAIGVGKWLAFRRYCAKLRRQLALAVTDPTDGHTREDMVAAQEWVMAAAGRNEYLANNRLGDPSADRFYQTRRRWLERHQYARRRAYCRSLLRSVAERIAALNAGAGSNPSTPGVIICTGGHEPWLRSWGGVGAIEALCGTIELVTTCLSGTSVVELPPWQLDDYDRARIINGHCDYTAEQVRELAAELHCALFGQRLLALEPPLLGSHGLVARDRAVADLASLRSAVPPAAPTLLGWAAWASGTIDRLTALLQEPSLRSWSFVGHDRTMTLNTSLQVMLVRLAATVARLNDPLEWARHASALRVAASLLRDRGELLRAWQLQDDPAADVAADHAAIMAANYWLQEHCTVIPAHTA